MQVLFLFAISSNAYTKGVLNVDKIYLLMIACTEQNTRNGRAALVRQKVMHLSDIRHCALHLSDKK